VIRLGKLSRGTSRIAYRARAAIVTSGQAAIFLSRGTGNAVAVAYTAPDFEWQCRRHLQHLVGVYTDPLDDGRALLAQLNDDLLAHVQPARGRVAA